MSSPSAIARPPPSPRVRLSFGAGPSGSVPSVNDGVLDEEVGAAGRDAYEVDPTTTTGSSSRWDNAVGQGDMSYVALDENDANCLTYTTAALTEDLTVVGHPIVRLFVASSTGDADLHVLLEEVDEEGEVRYVTEGVLRASMRKLSRPRYDNLGLPFQMCLESDAAPLPEDAPAEVSMDLHPTATVFDAGHRLRISIMGADADNTEIAPSAGDTVLRVFHGVGHASGIELPVLR